MGYYKHSDVMKDTQICIHDDCRLPVFYNDFDFGNSRITIQTFCSVIDGSISSAFYSEWDDEAGDFIHDKSTHVTKHIKDNLHDKCTLDILYNQHKKLDFYKIVDEVLDFYEMDRVK